MNWLPIAVGALVSAGALIYALVLQRQKWQAESRALKIETAAKLAGARVRELTGNLEDLKKRTRSQVAILQADIAELEQYIADTCTEDGALNGLGMRYFASVQSIRDTAARLAADHRAVPDRSAARAPTERPGDTE